MDDIGIATNVRPPSTIMSQHTRRFRVSREHDLFYKLEKCLFHSPTMDYLGVVLEEGVTRMDPSNLTAFTTGHALHTQVLTRSFGLWQFFTAPLYHVSLTSVYR